MNDVRKEVRLLNARVDGTEAISRLMFEVQVEQLAKAEQLRKLALDAVDDRVMPLTRQAAVLRLRWFVENLPVFHEHPAAALMKKKAKARARKSERRRK